jgi:pSer/pThr/pTyr-binding forkhead associated (FHA) protein
MSRGPSSTPVPDVEEEKETMLDTPELEAAGLRPAEVEDDISTMMAVPPAHLVLELSAGESRIIPLLGDLRIGRGSGNDLRLPDPKLSRRHALISVTAEGYLLQDMESRNGIFVNDSRLREPYLLRDGDVICLGDVRLTFRPEEASASSPPLPPPPPQPVAYLIVQPPFGSPQRFPVADEMRIGRRAGNDLQLNHSRISRQHAIIIRTAKGYVLHDLGSHNGTYLNGQLVVGQRLLEDGDVIAIGDITITFKVEFSPAAGASPRCPAVVDEGR